MSENIRNQLDEYVKLIEREVRGALERFEPLYLSSDMKVNIDFINDIKDVTINGVSQICKRFEIELKLKKLDHLKTSASASYSSALKYVSGQNSTENVLNQESDSHDLCDVMSVTSSHAGEDSLDPKDALIGQNKIMNSIYIQGIPMDLLKNEQFKTGVVQKLCKKASVPYKEFRDAYIKTNALIVRFHRLEPKEKIISYAEDKDIWTNELYDLPKGEVPTTIKIRHYMTQFYSTLWYQAQKFKDQERLHSFKLTEKGLLVKRKPHNAEKIFLTRQDLIDYVNK